MARICQLSHVEVTFNFLAPLIHALVNKGHQVTVACLMDAGGAHLAHYLRLESISIEKIPVARKLSLRALTIDVLALARFLRRGRFDVLHVHGPMPALQARIAARIAGVPIVIYHAHGFFFHDGMSRTTLAVTKSIEYTWCRLLTDYLITINSEDYQTARTRRFLSDVSRIRYFPGVGIDTDRFAPSVNASRLRQELEAEGCCRADQRAVVFVGRVVREKGVRELLTAFAEVHRTRPDLVLLILGETLPSERDQETQIWMRAFLTEHALQDSVRLLGRRYDVERYLQAADLFVLPTYREGMPVSLMEAMSCGVACIATDVRGCRDAIQDKVTGLLIPPRDSHALVWAMSWVLDSEDNRRELGRRARADAVERFSVDVVVSGELSLYNDILEEPGRSA